MCQVRNGEEPMITLSRLNVVLGTLITACVLSVAGYGDVAQADAPTPLLEKGRSVEWWFVFKFNTKAFSGCGGASRQCIFGGAVQDYTRSFGQQFVYASKGTSLQKGSNCLGDTTKDPVGATFDQVYNGAYYYVIWNDQFYNDPDISACNGKTYCGAPWAHSKGILAWDDDGAGFVMQVSTPNWPGAGNKQAPRQNNGNTLGCLTEDGQKPQDNVLVSQHFFSLKLTKDDVLTVLAALQHAGVLTEHDPGATDRDQVVKNGGPVEISQKVDELGVLSESTSYTKATLSSGVQLIAKSARLTVPPWQMVSAVLGGVPLRVATWYSTNKIPDTVAQAEPGCWDATLQKPGAVTNVASGHWGNTPFGLTGGSSPDRNHAKIGVSTSGRYVIFGDMNQEGALSGLKCNVGQNARGGLFFVVEDDVLSRAVRSLLTPLPPR
jgi:hypothetical protein